MNHKILVIAGIMLVVTAALLVVFWLSGDWQSAHPPTTQQKGAECVLDNDCIAGGCSGQLCLTKEQAASMLSTCEWRDEYACYKLDNCLCQSGRCQWQENEDFSKCLANLEQE